MSFACEWVFGRHFSPMKMIKLKMMGLRTDVRKRTYKKRVRERFIGKRVNVVKVNNCHNICSKESCENHAPPQQHSEM